MELPYSLVAIIIEFTEKRKMKYYNWSPGDETQNSVKNLAKNEKKKNYPGWSGKIVKFIKGFASHLWLNSILCRNMFGQQHTKSHWSKWILNLVWNIGGIGGGIIKTKHARIGQLLNRIEVKCTVILHLNESLESKLWKCCTFHNHHPRICLWLVTGQRKSNYRLRCQHRNGY